jgi:hypothetical protein
MKNAIMVQLGQEIKQEINKHLEEFIETTVKNTVAQKMGGIAIRLNDVVRFETVGRELRITCEMKE